MIELPADGRNASLRWNGPVSIAKKLTSSHNYDHPIHGPPAAWFEGGIEPFLHNTPTRGIIICPSSFCPKNTDCQMNTKSAYRTAVLFENIRKKNGKWVMGSLELISFQQMSAVQLIIIFYWVSAQKWPNYDAADLYVNSTANKSQSTGSPYAVLKSIKEY